MTLPTAAEARALYDALDDDAKRELLTLEPEDNALAQFASTALRNFVRLAVQVEILRAALRQACDTLDDCAWKLALKGENLGGDIETVRANRKELLG